MAGSEIVDAPVSPVLPAEITAGVEPDEHELPIVESAGKLSMRDRAMLVFERKWWRHAGSKEQAIREQFELSATRYYQVLNKLLDMPEALEFDPVTVGRLRRLRATRSRARTGRPSVAEG
jgi:uncharacterized protein DUF3263